MLGISVCPLYYPLHIVDRSFRFFFILFLLRRSQHTRAFVATLPRTKVIYPGTKVVARAFALSRHKRLNPILLPHLQNKIKCRPSQKRRRALMMMILKWADLMSRRKPR